MIFCKICGKQVKIGSRFDAEPRLWQHMKEKHPKQFKEQKNKYIEDLFKDNFTMDNPESDVFAEMEG